LYDLRSHVAGSATKYLDFLVGLQAGAETEIDELG